MPRCADLQTDSLSANKWDYCLDERSKSRNWYEAMADCRDFGGELVSLEWPAKIADIQEHLSGRGVILSSGVFVNAHRPFYSASGFAWSSGIEIPLKSYKYSMEECVLYSSNGLQQISCNSHFYGYPLVCQRVSLRMGGTSELENLLQQLSAKKLNFFRKTINYSVESCDYFAFAKFNYSWYCNITVTVKLSSMLKGAEFNALLVIQKLMERGAPGALLK